MSITLQMDKGDVVALKGESKVSEALIGLGWDPRVSPGTAFDLDAVLIGRNAAGQTQGDWVCYFNKLNIGWATHSGDSLTGEGQMDASGDDEQIRVKLASVPAEVTHIDVLVIIYAAKARQQTFGDLTSAHVRLADGVSGDEKAKYNLTADDMFAGEGMLFAQIVRKGPMWEFRAVGKTAPEYADVNSAANATSMPA